MSEEKLHKSYERQSPDIKAQEMMEGSPGVLAENEEKIGWLRRLIAIFTTSPYDWYLSINEEFTTIDWDSKSNSVAWPLGNFMTALFFVVRLLQDNVITPNIHKLNNSDDAFDFSKSDYLRNYEYFQQYQETQSSSDNLFHDTLRALQSACKFSGALLILANMTVTYKYLFGKYQSYSLFCWKVKPISKNLIKKSLRDLNYKYVEDAQRGSLWGMVKYMFFNKIDRNDLTHKQYYYELNKWCPSKFLTSLFVSFSPICLSFLWVTDVSFRSFIPVILHQYILWFLVVDRYEQKLIDEKILYSSNLAEIDSKVVGPKANALKQDAMVDATPYHGGEVFFYPAYTTTRSHVFETHSLEGQLIREKFNPETSMFEDTRQKKTTNYQRPNRWYNRFNGASFRNSSISRQLSPRRTASPYLHNYDESSFSAPSTPMLIPSQQPYFDHSMLGNISRQHNSPSPLGNVRHSHSPVKAQPPSRLLHNPDANGYSVSDLYENRLRFDERMRRGRQPMRPDPSAEDVISNNYEGGTPSRSPFRNSSRSTYR